MSEAKESPRPIRPLRELLPSGVVDPAVGELKVSGVAERSDEVRHGDLFVAIQGSRLDGHEYVTDAVERGAVAILAQRPLGSEPGVPVIIVPDTRAAVSEIASAWHGHPSRRLGLVGITGTIGKTSVLKMLEAMVRASGIGIGTIGTLGVSAGGEETLTGYTAPDPMLLHHALAGMVEAGCTLAAMEVTSHALHQQRVRGLRYDLGVFTNLVPLEHADYHGSFREYVKVKRRFLSHLKPEAPLIYSEENQIVRHSVRSHTGPLIGCGTGTRGVVAAENVEVSTTGMSFDLVLRSRIPLIGGGFVDPVSFPIRTPLLGRPAVANAAMAAAAALCVGADPFHIQQALRVTRPLKRRMQLEDFGRFWVMDDGASHPDSVSALFEVVESLPVNRVHAVFAIRGSRGTKINRRNAEALAIWAARRPLDFLVLTRSEDAVDDLNRVEPEERDAFRSSLRHAGIDFAEAATLDGALTSVLDRTGAGDLVLLLGTQGMDQGADRLKRLLAASSPEPPPASQAT
jgi:UDP-N-acetylmuramoyl-L-alanyl-D-glutamate--2,6-diaminopimelate ligase